MWNSYYFYGKKLRYLFDNVTVLFPKMTVIFYQSDCYICDQNDRYSWPRWRVATKMTFLKYQNDHYFSTKMTVHSKKSWPNWPLFQTKMTVIQIKITVICWTEINGHLGKKTVQNNRYLYQNDHDLQKKLTIILESQWCWRQRYVGDNYRMFWRHVNRSPT